MFRQPLSKKTENLAVSNFESQLTISLMKQEELKMVLDWAKKEGWNPGRYDYNSYYAADNQGFLLLNINNRPVASISIVRHNRNFAFIGLFIVLPEFRNQGYGTYLWNEAIKRLSNYNSIGLCSVAAQVSRYSKSEFSQTHRIFRWQMTESKKENNPVFIDTNMSEGQNDVFGKVITYDQTLWGSSRKAFFNTILLQPESYALAYFENGKVQGFGIIRPCVEGYRIGPLYSDEPENAKTLTNLLISQIPNNSKIIFDIPNKNKFSQMFAEYFKLENIENANTEAMVKGEIQEHGESRCYGLASLEIG